jgi:hypothetical protein
MPDRHGVGDWDGGQGSIPGNRHQWAARLAALGHPPHKEMARTLREEALGDIGYHHLGMEF